jgi:hypothetical protein
MIILESKYILKTMTFWVFVFTISLMFFTQFNIEKIEKPDKDIKKIEDGYENQGVIFRGNTLKEKIYGIREVNNNEEEMKAFLILLKDSYNWGVVQKVRFGFVSEITLNNNQKSEIKEYINDILTGNKGIEEIDIYNFESYSINISYDKFQKIVEKLVDEYGKNSEFNDTLYIPKTYEEALEDYYNVINKDRYSNAHARLFSDYLGIVISVIPLFLAAFIFTRDKKNKVYQSIYTKNISSTKYILSKYLSLNILIFIVLIIFVSIATYQTINLYGINNIDLLAYYKYLIIWLMPTCLFVVVLSMLISIIFDSGLIVIPVILFLNINSILNLIGDYSLDKYIIRFNYVGEYQIYINNLNLILLNRIFYTIISFLMLIILIIVFDYKRSRNGGIKNAFFSRFKNKS